MKMNIQGEPGTNNRFEEFHIDHVDNLCPNATQVIQNFYYTPDSDVGMRHSSDEATIRGLMRHTNVLLMDMYFKQGPARVSQKVISIHDAWCRTLTSSSFVIYNSILRGYVTDFFTAWHSMVCLGATHYESSCNGQDVVFGGGLAESDMFHNNEERLCFEELVRRWHYVSVLFTSMMDCIKQTYVIDFNDVDIK